MSVILITSKMFSLATEAVALLESYGHTTRINLHPDRPLTVQELLTLVKPVEGMIISDDPITREVIESAPDLKVISKNGVGVDQIDLRAATERAVVVTNTPGVNANAVADLAIGLMICVARQIPLVDKLTKQGKWDRMLGVEVWGKTLGIVGLGHIGRGVARRAKGFNMRLLGFDVLQDHEFAREVDLKYVDLNTLLQESDFVSLHVPRTDGTKGLINRHTLSWMKPTAYLINTARGEIVDGEALYEAIRNKVIAGAAVDVYQDEPPLSDPLLTLPNVVTTSHIGAFSGEAIAEQCMTAAKNLVEVMGRNFSKAHVVNRDVLSRIV